jgi:hypothetical protein
LSALDASLRRNARDVVRLRRADKASRPTSSLDGIDASMQTSLVSLCLVVSLFGCFVAPPTYAPSSSLGEGPWFASCTKFLDDYEAAYCAPDIQAGLASGAVESTTSIASLLRTNVAQIQASCTDSTLAPRFVALDRCANQIALLEVQERAAQQARLPEVRRKEPKIRQDARYANAVRELEDRRHAATVANDNLKTATAQRRSSLHSYQRAKSRADEAVRESEAELSEVLESYGVDQRDARLVALWP